MAKSSAAGLLTSVDSMFTTQEERDNAQRSYVTDLPIAEISDFPDHPFKVRMDESISGAAIREAPSVDVPKLIYEVRRVGASLNRILIIANAKGLLEVPELRKAMERNRELEVRIVDAYTKD